MGFAEAKWTVDKLNEEMRPHVKITFGTWLIGQTVTFTSEQGTVVTSTVPNKTVPILRVTLPEIGEWTISCHNTIKTVEAEMCGYYKVKIGGIYGYRVKASAAESDPGASVEYIDDAVGFKAARMNYSTKVFDYGDWADAWFLTRPCMLKSDGTVDYYLDPDDFTLKEDGVTASDAANASYDGNVMIEIPQTWVKRSTDSSGYRIYEFCDSQADSDFHAYAHADHAGAVNQKSYIGAFDGTLVSGKLRSIISSGTPLNSVTRQSEVTYAQANGTGWDTWTFAQWTLLGDLLTLMSKSTNSQDCYGYGYCDGGSAASSLKVPGSLKDKGMFYGTTTNAPVKVFGIENFWGNIWKGVRGLVIAGSLIKVKATYGEEDGSTVQGFNFDGTGYVSTGIYPTGTNGGYISDFIVTALGTFMKTVSGSSTTWLCDGGWFANGTYAIVGGDCGDGALCGSRCCTLCTAASDAVWNVGASISYNAAAAA